MKRCFFISHPKITSEEATNNGEQKPMAVAVALQAEQELQELACEWPMKRLVEIWNRLPGSSTGGPVHGCSGSNMQRNTQLMRAAD